MFQPHFAWHIIQLMQVEEKVLPIALGFTYFRGASCTSKPQLLLVIFFIPCNMKTNTVMIIYLFQNVNFHSENID